MPTIADPIAALFDSRVWALIVPMAALLALFLKAYLKNPNDRATLDGYLASRRYATIYGDYLNRALDRVDRWLTPSVAPSSEASQRAARRPWSWPLMDVALRLALVYPLLSLILGWVIGGFDGRIGDFQITPQGRAWERLSVFAIYSCVAFASFRFFSDRSIYLKYHYLNLDILASAILAVFGLFILGASAGFGAFIIIVSIGFYGVLSISFTTIASLLISYFWLYENIQAILLSFFAGLILAIALALPVALIAQRSRYGLSAYFILISFLVAALSFIIPAASPLPHASHALVLLAALLPLLNAMFDFFSIGLTRWLLRRGANTGGRGALFWALADLAAAAVLFALLGVTLITYVEWLNERMLAPLVDFAALFADIRGEPRAYWWLYVTIFTTLLPTLAHLVLASFSFIIAFMPERAARFVRRQLPGIGQSEVPLWGAWLVLSTLGTLAIAAVVHFFWGLFLVAQHFFPELGFAYLWLFELYAAWLGAPVTPVPPVWLESSPWRGVGG